jgi:hypothetical protein
VSFRHLAPDCGLNNRAEERALCQHVGRPVVRGDGFYEDHRAFRVFQAERKDILIGLRPIPASRLVSIGKFDYDQKARPIALNDFAWIAMDEEASLEGRQRRVDAGFGLDVADIAQKSQSKVESNLLRRDPFKSSVRRVR